MQRLLLLALFCATTTLSAQTPQSNDGGFDSGLAFRIAAAFFPEITPKVAAAAATAFDPASYDARRFDQFVRRYALDASPQFVLTFSRSGDSLIAQATGQQPIQLTPTSDSTFTLRGVPPHSPIVSGSAIRSEPNTT